MRLFIAVEVGAAVAPRAIEVRRAIEREDADLCRRGMKWVEPANLHLTLRFLGEVGASLAEEVIAAFRQPVAQAPFALAFGGPAWLPGPSRPRVLMLPLDRDLASLTALKRTIDDRLPAGVPPEEARPFRPHLTLARVRDGWQDRARGAAGVLGDVLPLEEGGRIGSAVLLESHLGSHGPSYAERARVRLVAP
jgi:2'-5' RNA ligase